MPKKQTPDQAAHFSYQAVNKSLGSAIHKARCDAGLNQGQVGALIGVTFQQVQKYENGLNQIPIGRLLHLCVVLEADILEVIQHVWLESVEVQKGKCLKRRNFSIA